MIETVSTSELAEHLRERIQREGPITFCDWMRAALYDPNNGYYCRPGRTKWGREGDYRTSPERSSLFGATLARYFAKIYQEIGKPSTWTILEFGAGEGEFAASMLQALELYFPHVFLATRFVIDEISPHSQLVARKRLLHFADRVSFESVDNVEIDFGIVFSNELLDAFPVHRVKMVGGRLREFYVDMGAKRDFVWTLLSLSTERLTDYFNQYDIQLDEGQVAEVNLEIEEWLKNVATRLRRGYLITVDYGAAAQQLYSSTARPEGTLRGFRRHRLVDDCLAQPGEQDLTSTVNWTLVERLGTQLGFELVEFASQDKFLLAAGLLDQLALESQRGISEVEKLRLSTAAREMILPDGMGAHFQVLVQCKTSKTR